MDDAKAPLQVAGETAIPSCVMLTRLMMLVMGLLTMWPLAIQTATDVGIKAAATDDQRDIDKVHPRLWFLLVRLLLYGRQLLRLLITELMSRRRR